MTTNLTMNHTQTLIGLKEKNQEEHICMTMVRQPGYEYKWKESRIKMIGLVGKVIVY